MKVFLTGGTGFIGSRLALECLRLGHSVKVFGLENTEAERENSRFLRERGAEVVLGSVTGGDLLRSEIRGAEWVFHLAAAQHEAQASDQLFREVNVRGTENVLNASLKAGVRRFVHGSTIGVYGSLEGEIDEESPCNPDNVYGTTKLEAERIVRSYSEKLPVVIIRISETYGPGDRRLLKLFRGVEKGMFFIAGSGRNLHHPIYVDDLVQGLLIAAEHEAAAGEVFVLAGREPVTTETMVGTIARCLGKRPRRLRVPLLLLLAAAFAMETVLKPVGIKPPLHRRRLDFFRKSFHFSARKASDMLGFVPKFSFEEGVKETLRWYRERGYL